MKALVAPDHETAFAYYEKIVEAKQHIGHSQRTILRDRVREAYSRYWIHRAALEQLAAMQEFSGDERKLLVDCYDNEKRAVKPLKELMGIIKARQTDQARAVCQHCGLDSPATFDHYLPKKRFQEFAVCALNLVPCCYVCNGSRNERWVEDAERVSIHLYFDEIDAETRYVEADVIKYQGGDFRVTYRLDESSMNEFARRYRRHCKTLNLLGRFAERATGYLDRIRLEITEMGEASIEGVAQRFRSQATAWTPALGANNWEVALYHAVSRAPEFIAHAMRSPGVVP
jgi:hypothetical protein